jgi:hypothetical protein
MKTYSRKIHNALFYASAEELLINQVQGLFQIIEGIPPEKIKNGFSTELGGMIFYLREKDGDYYIAAPDYVKNPHIDDTYDLTISLWVLFEQVRLLKQYNIDGEATRFSDRVFVAKESFSESTIRMERIPVSNKGNSGWYIEALPSNVDMGLEAIHAIQLLKLRPSLIKVLGLPFGYMVIFEGDTIKEIIDEKNENIME